MSREWSNEEIDFLIEHYEIKGCNYCSKVLGRSSSSVRHKVSRLGIKRKGEGREVRIISHKDGYLAVSALNFREPLHRLIMEYKLGRKLKPEEIVHHIDEDKQNNHPDNLTLVTRSKHMKLHDRPRNEKGQFIADDIV